MANKKLKILYGVQTTGNGHLTHSSLIIKELVNAGHHIDVILSGPKNTLISEITSLPVAVTQYKGLTFKHKNGQLKKIKTVLSLDFKSFFKSIKALGNLRCYDLIISDYEPITAWASKINKKLSIGLSHQSAFTSEHTPFPKYHALDKLILNQFSPTQINIGLHWFPFASNILPPVILDNFSMYSTYERAHFPEKTRFQLVYLPFEKLNQLKNFFLSFAGEHFVIFHPDVKQEEYQKNITLKTLGRENFISHLIHCEGIITNSGFGTISEGLMLGKKILTKPLRGQVEQHANALALMKLKYADVMQTLNASQLESWLIKKNYTKITFPNVVPPLVDWISRGEYEEIQSISDYLWNKVQIKKT